MSNSEQNSPCRDATPYYYDYLCGQQNQIPETVSVHITDCENCLHEIEWLKQADEQSGGFSLKQLQVVSHVSQMQLHSALIDQPVRCSTIKAFLPLLAIPDMAVRITTPVTAHIEACRACARDLKLMQESDLSPEQLTVLSRIAAGHDTENGDDIDTTSACFPQDAHKPLKVIREIINRPDSGVVTCFHAHAAVSESSNTFTVDITQDDTCQPSDLPIDTERMLNRQHTPVPARSRWILKPLAAAAAVLIIGLLLFRNPSLKATDIGEIYEALKNVKNVVMAQYEIGNPDPIQQVWISRSLGIKLFKTNDEFVLYDVKNKIQKTKPDSASAVQQIDIDSVTAKSVTDTMQIPWGLLPFNKASALPDGAVWEKTQLVENVSKPEKTEVYDLFWSKRSIGGKDISYQWRCHVDAVTKRPFKVEWWQKNEQTHEYELTTYNEVTYPTEAQIQEVVGRAGL